MVKVFKRFLKLICVYFMVSVSYLVNCQNTKVDSLENLLQNHLNKDTVRVKLLNNFYASNQSPERQSMSITVTFKRLKMLAKEFKVNTYVKIEDRSAFNEVETLVTLVMPYNIDKLIND